MNDQSAKQLRVAICQPALPKYRIPLFRQLGQSYRVKVFFGAEKDLSNEGTADFENCPVKEWKVKLPNLGYLSWSWSQIGVCGDSSWDVIVLSWNTRCFSLIPSLIRARWNRVPTILWGHGYSKSSGPVRRWFRNRVARLGTAVMFYDPVTKTEFQQTMGWGNCFVAPNAIDSTPIQEQINQWQDARLESFQEEQGIQERDVVLFVSRFDPDNQLELLIRSLPEIRRKRSNVLAVLIGGGPDEDRLRSLVKALGCEENVRFTGPIYEEENLAPWFLSSRLFCYPANIGLSLMHAFNYGLPVVLGDDLSRCNPEIYAFDEGQNGATFTAGKPTSLGEKIVDLLEDQESLSRLAAGAKKTATTVTTLEAFVEGYQEAIEFAAQHAPT